MADGVEIVGVGETVGVGVGASAGLVGGAVVAVLALTGTTAWAGCNSGGTAPG